MANSKRVKSWADKIDLEKLYPLTEALQLLKECSTVKFDESVEVAVNLGIDARKSDQAVRGATVLPKGTGKTVRVAVFAQGEQAEAAKLRVLMWLASKTWQRACRLVKWILMWLLRRQMQCQLSVSWARYWDLVV